MDSYIKTVILKGENWLIEKKTRKSTESENLNCLATSFPVSDIRINISLIY